MKVRISAEAKRDLRQIAHFIAEDNPTRAESFIAELENACLSLGETPKASPVLRKRRNWSIRRRPFENYLIFYIAGDDIVEIARVIHGARNYKALLSKIEPT